MSGDNRGLFRSGLSYYEPNQDDAAEFCRLVEPMTDQICIQTFSEGIKKNARLARTLHGSLAVLRPELVALNQQGAGIFCSINAVLPGNARCSENVTRVRAFVADNDNPANAGRVRAELRARGIEPSFIVESSPGKEHFYFLVEGCKLEEFKPTQRAIATALGTDLNICDLPRVMRLPGFYHTKSTPFMVRIVRAA